MSEEPTGPRKLDVRFNSPENTYDIIDAATGEPALNAKGTRFDGGGHTVEDTAIRQMGYIQPALDKKWAEFDKQAKE